MKWSMCSLYNHGRKIKEGDFINSSQMLGKSSHGNYNFPQNEKKAQLKIKMTPVLMPTSLTH